MRQTTVCSFIINHNCSSLSCALDSSRELCMLEAQKCIRNEISLCVSLWFSLKNQREECRAAGGGKMECSWKTVLLLVCASLGVQYTAIRTLKDSVSGPCQGAYPCQSRHHRGTAKKTFCE